MSAINRGVVDSGPMAAPVSVDVLVIGSGASGLAAAVSGHRAGASVALAAKGSLQSCNSAKAQGGIHWLEELGVQFTRENGGYRLAKCGGASRKRLLQVGDRTGHAITAA